MCKPKINFSLGSLARLSALSWSYLLRTLDIYLCVVLGNLVEYTLNLNSMIEIVPELCPMLAFLCKNLDYKLQTINQSSVQKSWKAIFRNL